MAETVCRSCGTAVAAGARMCPECGAADPIAASATHGPRPEAAGPVGDPGHTVTPRTDTTDGAGSRLKGAAKAIGCIVLAVIVLAIAIVAGLFDLFF